MPDQLTVLLLCDDRRSHAANVREHIAAFRRHSRHRIEVFNPRGVGRARRVDWSRYDVVVVHYTLIAARDEYLAPAFRQEISNFTGLKVQFMQDEYRWIDEMTSATRALGIGLLYTLVPPDALQGVYGGRLPGVELRTTLAGFVPDGLRARPLRPLADRNLDVVYRGRPVPYWLGRLGQDKVRIGQGFARRARELGLRVDIAWGEVDRIYGEDWYGFLAGSRTTLGTESGSSIVDFDGSVHLATDEYLAHYPTASFEDVERDVLAPHEGNVTINVASPRVFEAAALGTAMVNFVGRYSDIIEPWAHYVPLEKDFSNFEVVYSHIRDDGFLERMRRQAYEDLVASGRFSLARFVAGFDDDIDALAASRARRRRPGSLGVGGLPPLRLRETRVGTSAALLKARRFEQRLIESVPEVAALLAAAQKVVESERDRIRLRIDLVRLATVILAQRGDLKTIGAEFRADLHTGQGQAEFWFVSRAPGVPYDAAASSAAHEAITRLLPTAQLNALLWNHSPVGSTVTASAGPMVGSIVVGQYVVAGVHRFDALLTLLHRLPNEVTAAIGAALVAPAPMQIPIIRELTLIQYRIRLVTRHPFLALKYLLRKARQRASR